mgnify:CR=1 FL=1
MEQPALVLTFAAPDNHGVCATTWAFADQAPLTVPVMLPFAPEHVDLLLRALNARQYAASGTDPSRSFAPTSAECAALAQLGLWDEQRQQLPSDLHQRVGQRLGAALFADARVRALLPVLRQSQGTIVLATVPDLHARQHAGALPWELAVADGQPWLLHAGHVLPYVRLLIAPAPAVIWPERPQVLLLTPQAGFDAATRGYAQQARQAVRTALADRVDIHALGPPLTLKMLTDYLHAHPAVTLLDYYGHALRQEQQAYVLFDTAAGGPDLVSVAQLQALPHLPPCWIFALCQPTTSVAQAEPPVNLAAAFVAQSQVTAVLALHVPLPAAMVSQQIVPAIYQTLAQPASLQAAVTAARQRLYEATPNATSFDAPTLYLRQPQLTPCYLLRPQFGDKPRPQSGGNPFTPNQVPPTHFVGRRRELDDMLARLEQMMSVSLVGEARIGKSSLLCYLKARLPNALQACGTYLPIYMSMDNYDSQARFCRALLDQLLPHVPPVPGQEQTLRALERQSEPTLHETVRVLEWAKQGGLRVVLLLDEFKDVLQHAQEFNEVFRGTLRSLYTHRVIALIIATRQPLTTIEGLNTYFVNALEQFTLQTLSADEAEKLLRQPHQYTFTAAEERMALQVGAGHPFRLQWAGFLLYVSKSRPPGQFHQADRGLRRDAARILRREVEDRYARAMVCSHPVDPPPKREKKDRAALLEHLISQLAEVLDRFSARLTAVLLLLGLVALLLFAFGYLSLEQLQQWQSLLPGGA